VIDGRPKRNSLKLVKVLLTVNQGSFVLSLNLLNQSVSVLASLQDVLAIFLQTRDTHFDRHLLDKAGLISGAWVVVRESQVRSKFIANARDNRVAVVAAKHYASLANLGENSLFKLSYLLEGQLVFIRRIVLKSSMSTPTCKILFEMVRPLASISMVPPLLNSCLKPMMR